MRIHGVHTRTLRLEGAVLYLLDQTLLPHEVVWWRGETVEDVARAIETMVVRGAGAIGATAAAGMAIAAARAPDAAFHETIAANAHRLRSTRPTAHNLFHAIDTILAAIASQGDDLSAARAAAHDAAQAYATADAEACAAIGANGEPLLADGMGVATHCNAGWLAFVDWGSALSPIYTAHRAGKRLHVWADETRPRGQGARLTAFELGQEGVPHTVIPDGSLGHWMRRGRIQAMIVGADRIAANGDVANKIGTYMAALAAREHGVPFYVAATTPTIDHATSEGSLIEIEERGGDEVAYTWGWSDDDRYLRVRTTPASTPTANAAFDVTPAHLIAGIITERGIIQATREGIASSRSTR